MRVVAEDGLFHNHCAVRICRIARIYPRKSHPGAGLVAYNLAEILPGPCLYIAKKLDGPSAPFSRHVTARFIAYFEPATPLSANAPRSRLRDIGRICGNLWLVARATIPSVRFRPDLIHVHTPLPLALGLSVKWIRRCPLVLSFEGTDFYEFRKRAWLRGLISRTADHVVCFSQRMADEFAVLLPATPVTYIPTGVDLQAFAPQDVQRKTQIIAVGRLVWQKAYDDLLKAFASVVAQFPDYRLVIAGTGPLDQDLRRLAKDLSIDGFVDFVGSVPQDRLREMLRESQLFVMSSVSEGFAKALIEALACGLPVVATDVGGAREAVIAAGAIVPARDPEAFANAICDLLGDADKRSLAAANAIIASQRYGWSVVIRQYEDLYAQLTAR
jgi:glycosyltransferase involved in cell wall biosynthesis